MLQVQLVVAKSILLYIISLENGTEWTVRFTGIFSAGLRCQPIGINSHKLFTLYFEIENERMNKNEISLNQKMAFTIFAAGESIYKSINIILDYGICVYPLDTN